jgi:hypothetical protein
MSEKLPSSKSFDIVLKHVGGERRTVPVEYVASTFVAIRWGQSGIYDLNLAVNTLTARSLKARRKGKAHWQAEDIEAVRKMVRDYLAERAGDPTGERQLAFEHHVSNMPHSK